MNKEKEKQQKQRKQIKLLLLITTFVTVFILTLTLSVYRDMQTNKEQAQIAHEEAQRRQIDMEKESLRLQAEIEKDSSVCTGMVSPQTVEQIDRQKRLDALLENSFIDASYSAEGLCNHFNFYDCPINDDGKKLELSLSLRYVKQGTQEDAKENQEGQAFLKATLGELLEKGEAEAEVTVTALGTVEQYSFHPKLDGNLLLIKGTFENKFTGNGPYAISGTLRFKREHNQTDGSPIILPIQFGQRKDFIENDYAIAVMPSNADYYDPETFYEPYHIGLKGYRLLDRQAEYFGWVRGIEVKKAYYDSGELLSETFYQNGLQKGPRRLYFENGNLKSWTYHDTNLLDGPAEMFYEDGTLKSEGTFKNNELEGVLTTYDQNDVLVTQTVYVKGVREGTEKRYHPNGKLGAEIPYKANKPHGTTKIYDDTGALRNEIVSENGVALKGYIILPDGNKKELTSDELEQSLVE